MTTIKQDADVQAAVAHWAPRFVQNGVDYNDFVATTARVGSWAEWLPEWNRTADMHAEIAEKAEQDGHLLTAGHAWRRASVTRHFGKFVWMVDQALAAEATMRSAQEMRQAHRLIDATAERVETPFADSVIAATLRRPPQADPAPLVLLIPGLDSAKEEFFYLEQSFLDRGMATLSIDGPGQGETGLAIPIRPDYEAAVTAVLDMLPSTSGVDLARIGLCGVSLGGLYAPRIAAFEPRVRAMAAISGPYAFGEVLPSMPPVSRETFRVKAGAATDAEAMAVADALNLAGVCKRIAIPSLYVTGDADRIVPWQQTERQSRETPGGVFACYPGGSHGVSNLLHTVRPVIADWMHDRMGELS